jgi:hypothetical protein
VSEVRHESGVEVLTDLVRGMALEPRTISLEDAPNLELVDLKRRFIVSAVLTVPLFLLEMSTMLAPGLSKVLSPRVHRRLGRVNK